MRRETKKIVSIKRNKPLNILLKMIFIAIVFMTANVIVVTINTYHKSRDKNKEITLLEEKYNKLKKENLELKREKNLLKDKDEQEALARKIGFIKPGEVVFKIIPKKKTPDKDMREKGNGNRY